MTSVNIVRHLSNPTLYATNYLGVGVAIVLTAFGLPLPEEITLVLAGAAAYQGAMNVWVLLAVGGGAVIIADSWIYSLGRFWGPRVLRHRFFRWFLPPERIAQAEERFHRHFLWTLFAVRFLSGLRAATYFSAGTLRLPAYKFILTDLAAACIQVPLYTFVGYLFSPHVADIINFLKKADRWIAVTLALGAILLAVFIGYRLGAHRRREK